MKIAKNRYVQLLKSFTSLPVEGDVVWRYGYKKNPLMIGPVTMAAQAPVFESTFDPDAPNAVFEEASTSFGRESAEYKPQDYKQSQLIRLTDAALQQLSADITQAISLL